uniref:Zinc finger PHD-type domain-containing protein n=1 Tax=Timema douglasi TaxID=61478 RepID=A0A7R8ZD45_TIMDO|nr:unnamed protein product [Timema douglasi]
MRAWKESLVGCEATPRLSLSHTPSRKISFRFALDRAKGLKVIKQVSYPPHPPPPRFRFCIKGTWSLQAVVKFLRCSQVDSCTRPLSIRLTVASVASVFAVLQEARIMKIRQKQSKIQNNYSTSPNCNMQLVTMLSTFIVVLRSVTTKLYLEKYRSESAFEIGSHNACKHFVAKGTPVTKYVFDQNDKKEKCAKSDIRKADTSHMKMGWHFHGCKEDRMADMRWCTKCDKWYHEECIGLSAEELFAFEWPNGCLNHLIPSGHGKIFHVKDVRLKVADDLPLSITDSALNYECRMPLSMRRILDSLVVEKQKQVGRKEYESGYVGSSGEAAVSCSRSGRKRYLVKKEKEDEASEERGRKRRSRREAKYTEFGT